MKISVKDVSREMKSNIILDNINLKFESGKIYGLCGHNGSGKTMLLRAIAGLIQIDHGEIMIDEKILHKDIDYPPEMGLIIETPTFFKYYTGMENLQYLAEIRNQISQNDIIEALKRVGLDPNDRRTVAKYSLGMKQRLAIAQAVMEKPQFILLDEPTNALDPDAVIQFKKMMTEEKRRNACIIIATHNHQDIDELFDEKIYLNSGRVERVEKMTKNTKLYFMILLVLISVTIGYAFVTKYSFTGDYYLNKIKKQYNLDDFVYSNIKDSEYFNESISTLDELEKSSDLIVKVKPDDGKLFYNSIERQVKIIDIYRDKDSLKKGDTIYIQEPFSISYLKGMESMNSEKGYVLMNSNQEYILFLKHLDKADGYKYKDNEKITYVPVSTRLSKYCRQEKPLLVNASKIEDGELYYKDFKTSSAIFIKTDEWNRYNAIASQIYDKYK
ncbi:uncharacterized protein BN591_01291 [Catenibacterium sp. CAG:290]|uniref:ABC transporter ATP-binding protein n=1 Tax=Catenibacterium sp. CAG:290 TaxID=1262767 RepID=UPI00033D2E30|nr:ABC transporter ATP-binding protein [Catenibacterium sp. CAG:290]CDE28949.1 uncharacterized protein BN591_01291 [Catenibacterium sp. CAG:290]